MKTYTLKSYPVAIVALMFIALALSACKGSSSSTASPINIELVATSLSPAKDEEGVSFFTSLKVELAQGVDISSIDFNDFSLVDSKGNNVNGIVSYDEGSHLLNFKPAKPLFVSESYTASIRHGLKASNGASYNGFSWNFSTRERWDDRDPEIGPYYFSAQDTDNNLELWQSDGTSEGTLKVKEINDSGDSLDDGQDSESLFQYNGLVYFSATSGPVDRGFWMTNDQFEIVEDQNFKESGARYPHFFTLVNKQLFFGATDASHGSELWKWNGSSTSLFKDIYPGPVGSGVRALTVVDDSFYMVARSGSSGVSNPPYELWFSDGLVDGINMLWGAPGSTYSHSELTMMNGHLYFDGISSAGNDGELWTSNGTAAGTVLLKDINATGSSFPHFLTVFNDQLYFSANDGVNGYELWVSDGTALGTMMLKEFHTSGNGLPRDLTVMNGKLYFTAVDSVNGRNLWVSDGTSNGTVKIKNMGVIDNNFENLIVVNDKLIFSANDGPNGLEPWVSDGTAEGTFMLKDINSSGSSIVTNFVFRSHKNLLYFVAYDDVHGNEMWISDGTSSGTQLLKDINPGVGAGVR